MFSMPNDPSTIVSVLGIDPGSVNLGVGIIHFDLFTYQIVRCEAYTFDGGKLPHSEWMGSIATERLGRIAKHEDNLLRVLMRVQPLLVACESPFININRPAAYGALTEVVCAIRSAVRRYDAWRPVYMVTPGEAKNAVGAKGGADKDPVKQAMLKIPELVTTCEQDIRYLDEHSVDGLAVAYCQYRACCESRFSQLI